MVMASTVCPVPDGHPAEIIGYAEPWIVSPGEQVAIKVSSTASEFSHKLVRLVQGFEHPKAAALHIDDIAEVPSGVLPGRFQQAHIGSYGVVENIGLTEQDEGISISFLAQPYLLKSGHDQSLLSVLSKNLTSGFSIVINENGSLIVRIGNGSKLQELPVDYALVQKQWIDIRLTVQGSNADISITPIQYLSQKAGKPIEQKLSLGSPLSLPSNGRLVLGATQPHATIKATDHFNGRLEAVEIAAIGIKPRKLTKLDFRLKIPTDEIVDISGNGSHGYLVNAPSRAVTGHDWDGRETNWSRSTYGYGAIHFHEDDLDDAKWETDLTITIPPSTRSGAYALEVHNTSDESVKDYITFFVRPDYKTTTAKCALILSTFTYTAYANERLYDDTKASKLEPPGNFVLPPPSEDFRRMERRRDLGLSMYDVHKDGTGSVFSTTKRPILNVRPGYQWWALGRPREFSADLLMIGFLEKLGIPYDVTTDHDLHMFGVSAIERYTTVMSGSHPEYPSYESLTAYDAFASRGGNIMALGGNCLYWKSVVDPARPHRLEVRRGDQGIRTFCLPGGERHHSLDGSQGGLWRSLGRAANYLFALGCCGEGVGPGVAYKVSDAGKDSTFAWIWDGINTDELIGEEGFGGGASGDEIDRWDPQYGSPEDAVVLATSIGHPDEFVMFPEDIGFQVTEIKGTETDLIRSDITLHTTPGGGRVFAVGSMNWYCSLGWDAYENNVAKLTENILRSFTA